MYLDIIPLNNHHSANCHRVMPHNGISIAQAMEAFLINLEVQSLFGQQKLVNGQRQREVESVHWQLQVA